GRRIDLRADAGAIIVIDRPEDLGVAAEIVAHHVEVDGPEEVLGQPRGRGLEYVILSLRRVGKRSGGTAVGIRRHGYIPCLWAGLAYISCGKKKTGRTAFFSPRRR